MDQEVSFDLPPKAPTPGERFDRFIRNANLEKLGLPVPSSPEPKSDELSPEEQRDDLKRSFERFQQTDKRMEKYKEMTGLVDESKILDWRVSNDRAVLLSKVRSAETEEDRKDLLREMSRKDVLAGDLGTLNRLRKGMRLGLGILVTRANENLERLNKAQDPEEKKKISDELSQDWNFLLKQNFVVQAKDVEGKQKYVFTPEIIEIVGSSGARERAKTKESIQ